MKITTIGTNDLEVALARLWEQAGHTVTSLGLDGGDATDAEVIVVAVPSDAITALLRKVLGLEGKVTIDTTNPFAVYESGVMERTVVIEFPNVEQAIAAYESQDYQRALRALGDGAERDIRIIERAPSVSSPRR